MFGILPPVLTLSAVLLGLSLSLNVLLLTQRRQSQKSSQYPIPSTVEPTIEAYAEEDRLQEEKIKFAELQTQFILMLSHEYRTPLTTILTTTELLERYGNKITDQNKQRYHNRIKRSVQHLIKLLNETLLLENPGFPLVIQPFEITPFCYRILKQTQELAGDRLQVIHHFDQLPPGPIITDEVLLEQILNHLLSNAIKFSPTEDDRHPFIRFEVLYQSFTPREPGNIPTDRQNRQNRQKGLLIFKITDFGLGIPDHDRAHIYDRFYRGKNIGTIGGTGIGLTLAKQSIDRLGGTLQITSEEHRGTTARISLPIESHTSLSSKLDLKTL